MEASSRPRPAGDRAKAPLPPATEQRRPGQPPEYLDVYLPDTSSFQRPSAVGHGQRMVLTLEVGAKRSRVLAVSNLAVAWIPSDWLWGGKPLSTHGLMTKIRERRAERHKLGCSVSETAVHDALDLLAGKRVPTRQESEEVAGTEEEASVKPDDNQPASGGAAPPGTPAPAGAPATAPAAPAAGATQGATAVQTQTATQAKKAAAKAPAKKAAAKSAAKAAAKKAAAKAPVGQTNAQRDAATLKLKKAGAENPYKSGPRQVGFDLLKDGMTVGEFLKAADKKGIERNAANMVIRVYRNDGHLTVKEAK